MNIREQARLAGGEELVAKIDAAAKLEREIFTKVSALMEAVLADKEGEEEQIVLAAVCEALSSAYANAVVICTVKAFHANRTDGVITAIKSITGNINQAFDDLDAMENDVASRIAAAAKKGTK